MKITFNDIVEKEFVKVQILSSSSKGNCYLINNKIIIDIGVAYKTIEKFVSNLEKILISHEHGDHIKLPTLLKVLKENKKVQVFVNEAVYNLIMSDTRFKEFEYRILVVDIGKKYIFESNNVEYRFTPVKLYHDVQNYGFLFAYKNKINDKLISHFHGTDTHTLQGINGIKQCIDILTLECNYTPRKAQQVHQQCVKDKVYSNYNNVLSTHMGANEFVKFAFYCCKEEAIVRPCHLSSSNFDPYELIDIFKIEKEK